MSDGLTEPDNAFLKEVKGQISDLTGEVRELRETIEGDPRGRYEGLSARVGSLEKLVNSYEEEEKLRKKNEVAREKRSKVFLSLLTVLSVIIAILVGLNSLATSPLFGG